MTNEGMTKSETPLFSRGARKINAEARRERFFLMTGFLINIFIFSASPRPPRIFFVFRVFLRFLWLFYQPEARGPRGPRPTLHPCFIRVQSVAQSY